jgi:amino acid adenylation domain-containing protein/non-ribosomal peptide synthase protein (TIGR01720 family)
MSEAKQTNVEDIYQLSPVQQGMLFHTLLEPGSGMYFDQVISRLRFTREFDLDVFQRAWQKVVERQTVLRMALTWERRENPLQVVLQRVSLPVEQHDWRGLDTGEQERRLEFFLREDRRRGFDLSKAPLVRLTLFRLSDDIYQFVMSYHHILMDGWSLSLVLSEGLSIYEALIEGEDAKLGPVRPYREYISWLRAQDLTPAEEYWRRMLSGFTSATPLVVDTNRPDGTGQGHGEKYIWLSAESLAALNAFARKHQLTPSLVVQAAWALLLSRYSGEMDVVYGLTFSGRPPEIPDIERMVGLFINTLPTRVQVPPHETVSNWLKTLRAEQTELTGYEYSPLPQVQAWSDVPRGEPLFESVVVFQNLMGQAGGPRRQFKSMQVLSNHYVSRMNYPLSVVVAPEETLEIKINYDLRRFDGEVISRMLVHLKTLIEGIVANPEQLVCNVPLLSEDERRLMLREWNATARAYPADSCIHELVEVQAARDPQAVAVMIAGRMLSYGELNRRANRLARRLRALGVGPEVLVGICAERSFEMVVGMLAILKAGGGHVPLDPAYPKRRLHFMLEDARVPVLLVQNRLRESLPEHSAQEIILDDVPAETSPEDDANPQSGVLPDNGAYVIFTSGSTGRPKGILLAHRGLCNLIPAWNELFAVEEGSHVLQFASFSFDASVWEVFSALAAGARLCFGSRQTLYSGEELRDMLVRQEITHALLPPSLLGALDPGGLPTLKMLSAIGEKCTSEIAEKWSNGRRLFNAYGPAEATITVSAYEVEGGREQETAPPIGKPLANMQMYAVDRWLNPLPVGVAGELCIGGVGLARGYLTDAALTAEKFVPDPFSGQAGARLYRSGDLVRYRADSEVEYLGRIDHQVKVRGHRIELGEVEAALRRQRGVGEAVVVVREGEEGERRLVAYVVGEGGGSVPEWGELRGRLAEELPSYMVPAAWVELERLPLTPNGKVDRKALPAPDEVRTEQSDTYVAPRTPQEAALAEVWARTLGVERVGIHDNFFELGGDSILSIRVIARAKQRGLSLSPDRLFRHPTVAELAASLHSASSDSSMPSRTPRAPLSGPAPMLPAQLRFFEQTPVEPHHFNQAVLLAPTRHIDTRPLASAARALLSHHDALRARFSVEEGVWRQLIAPPSQAADFRIELVDLTGIGDVGEARAAMEAECGRLQSSFELGRGPLFAAALFELGGGRGQRLLLAAHHLVVDGVSWRVLLDDLERGYLQAEGGEAVELGEATASVAERARELEEWVRGESGREEAAYWAEVEGVKAEVVKGERVKAEGVRAEVVSGSVPVRDSLVDNVEGRVVRARRRLGAEVTRRVLAGSGAGRGAGAAEVLAAALGVALCGWSGAGEMLVDVEGHGRESASGLDLSRTVGWMTSVYPLRLRGGGAGEALRWAKEAMRGVPRGGVGYGALRYLGYLGREWSGASEGGRGVSFNYLGQFGEVGGGLWRWAEEGTGEWRSGRVERRYELEVEARVVEGEMEIGCGYVGGRQCEEEMEEMVRRMGELVEEMAGVGEGGATPSDFPDADLSQRKLDSALEEMELD